jgi:hypothetical protein
MTEKNLSPEQQAKKYMRGYTTNKARLERLRADKFIIENQGSCALPAMSDTMARANGSYVDSIPEWLLRLETIEAQIKKLTPLVEGLEKLLLDLKTARKAEYLVFIVVYTSGMSLRKARKVLKQQYHISSAYKFRRLHKSLTAQAITYMGIAFEKWAKPVDLTKIEKNGIIPLLSEIQTSNRD